ncbi:MAG: hypothetical protein HMLKMBBP_01601 [Planctomycetes bacterium]|nr:hypothetical protein [Planctomycetota bacterium]
MKTNILTYDQLGEAEQATLREYVRSQQDRHSLIRDHRETMAFAGFAVYLGAVAACLGSPDGPPILSAAGPSLFVPAFIAFWLYVAFYLRYQFRRRRWAALRVAGCDWLMAEWMPGSPQAMASMPEDPARPKAPTRLVVSLDVLWPLRASVVSIDSALRVYPPEIERAWILAGDRSTDALLHERIIHAAGWLGFAAVMLRVAL